MSEKHYVIALEKGVDKDQIMDELTRDTTSDSSVSSSIPDRQVQQVNARPSSKRLFEMELTDEEAVNLLNDSRVGGVNTCLLYTSPSPRDATLSRMPSSA